MTPLFTAALVACGGGNDGGSGSTPPLGPVAASVAVSPSASSVTTAQPLSVTVTVSGATATPDGTVVLTSGGFTGATASVSGGRATLAVPAGVLTTGSDQLVVQYTPSAAAAGAYLTGSGIASVSVNDAAMPTVTAQSSSIATAGHPFMALPLGANVAVSVSANTTTGSITGVRVFAAPTPGALTYVCTQTASHPNHAGIPYAFGLAALPNGLDLALAIDDAGIDLLDRTATLSSCKSGETLVPQGTIPGANGSPPGQGSFSVTVTPDGKYAFVANEYGVIANDSTGAGIQGNVGVVKLSYDASGHVSGGALVGAISTGGQAIANVTLSPDGSRLYVTSEIADLGVAPSGTANTVLAHGGCAQGTGQPTSTYGLLTVIDVAKAEAAPGGGAILASVASGCSPVRVVETADQQVIWVAARGDNRVLAFSTRTLETNPGSALLGYGDTGGVEPVGLQLFHGGQLLAVANSNRFATPSAVGNMTIMAAIPVHPAVLRTVAAGYFPRSVTAASDDATLYLTDYDSGLLQIISTSTAGPG